MALDQSALSSSLAGVFGSMPASASAAASALAAAYYGYAQGGAFGASLPTITTAHRDAMAATLLGAISVPATGSPATFAAAWAVALQAFWLSVPVTGPQTGATAGCPGAAAITGPLTALFASNPASASDCASALAGHLHTATLTVAAAVTPPPGTVLTLA